MQDKANLVSIKLKCGDSEGEIPIDKAYFSAQDCECELCWSHGWVRVSFTCPVCTKSHTIHLSDW